MSRSVFSIFLLVPLCLACKETIEPDLSAIGYDFYPLETGSYLTYDVQKIIFKELTPPDTDVYQLRMVITDSVLSNSGETNYLIERSKRETSDDIWVLDSIWTVYKNDIQLVINENNIPIIKLVFPFGEEKSWDSNGLNTSPRDDFKMRDLFQSYSSTFGDYQSTVKVIQEEKLDTIIQFDYRYEVYARNIGLVEKGFSFLNFCQADSCLGQKIIDNGEILMQRLTEYGEK